jgi:hypothetical protein
MHSLLLSRLAQSQCVGRNPSTELSSRVAAAFVTKGASLTKHRPDSLLRGSGANSETPVIPQKKRDKSERYVSRLAKQRGAKPTG